MTNKIKISFKEYLSEAYDKPSKLHEAYSLFHRYSLHNSILAENQLTKPEPINTYHGWQKIGRQVIKGSKAINLLMPVTCKTEDKKGEEKTFTKFIERPYWFGLSQTEGKEFLPEQLPGFEIIKALKILGITQEEFRSINGNYQGYVFPDLNIIAVNSLAYAPYKTAIHEIAHCLLHKDSAKIVDGADLEKSVKEFEAETVAYLVCCSLGKFEHLDYSRGYIANWIRRDDIEEKNFKRAFDTANKILKAGSTEGEGK